ncbi:MAG: hypothetical protein K2K30_05240 [Alistipes sp.]|nr:hypothetical protein [Alistipes sp.]MDE6623778.1 hypothetical protein [Alistipes sp.]
MIVPILLFGLLGDCFLSALVGIFGSGRRIGFTWTFLVSILLTPLAGLVVALLSDPLPGREKRWGCLGVLLALAGLLCLGMLLLLLLGGAAALLA